MNGLSPSLRHGLTVALAYAVAGALWIAYSDGLASRLASDEAQLTLLQTVKGWVFVGLSAVLICAMVRRAVQREAETNRALRHSEASYRGFFDQAGVGMAEVDTTGHWLLVNPRLCEILGYSAGEVLRRTSIDLTHPDDVTAEQESMRRLLSGEARACLREKRYVRRDGSVVWVLLSANLVRDEDSDEPLHFIAIVQDITDRKHATDRLEAALAEKEVLLGEIHHRVRNNLQLIISLLSIEASKFPDPQVQAAFSDSLARIEAMGLIHRQLYQSRDFVNIGLDVYVRDLCKTIATATAPGAVTFRFELAAIRCPLAQAIPIGIILVELLLNALKHAFPDGRPGTILIRLGSSHELVRLEVEDDGIGGGPAMAERTGLTIVRMLAEQLGGRLATDTSPAGGMRVTLEVGAALPSELPRP